jgi:putative transposase
MGQRASAAGAAENSPPFQRWVERPGKTASPVGTADTMHTFTSCHLHFVWSTKERRRSITPALQPRLWAYLGGIARANKMAPIEIGGVEDHVHVLLSLPATLSISKAAQLLKGNSSKWIHEMFPGQRLFEWQEGYGAFSLGVSGIDATVKYIRAQAKHHMTRSFKEEFVDFLVKHGMTYEDNMLD